MCRIYNYQGKFAYTLWCDRPPVAEALQADPCPALGNIMLALVVLYDGTRCFIALTDLPATMQAELMREYVTDALEWDSAA